MKINWKKFNRKTHYWGSIVCALPILVVIGSGVVLLFKKDVGWIQPPSMQGSGSTPKVSFDQILTTSKTVEQAKIQGWEDIDRLDVRPGKGIVKVRAKNDWEIQIDTQSNEILQVAHRRSDFIESIHDGTFFHDAVKLWVFLPSSLILFVLWVTGLYLFLTMHFKKRSRKQKADEASQEIEY